MTTLTPNPGRYWSSTVTTIQRWWYDKDKPADVALLTAGLVVLARRDPLTASLLAAAAYFGIGKVLVAFELIPHGGHKTLAREAIQWCAEISVIALVPALAWAAGRGLIGLAAPAVALAAYVAAAAVLSTFT